MAQTRRQCDQCRYQARLLASSCVAGWVLLLSGCFEQKPNLVDARGKITIQGQPAANISIQFLPDVKENTPGLWPSSVAISQKDGSFELATIDNQPGAVPGRHKIVLADMDEERPEQGRERTRPVRLDASYSIAGTLTAVVEEGKTIELVIP